MPAYNWSATAAPAVSTTGLSSYGPDGTTWAEPDQTEPDLDPTFGQITSYRCIAEGVARRLSMARGSCPDDPNAGEDLRLWLNRKWTIQRAFEAKVAVEREAMKDERVRRASCTLTYLTTTRSLLVDVELTPVQGKAFKFTLGIDSVAVTLLRIAA